jgi:hypothetical protein
MIREVQEAARAKELQLHVAKAGTEAEIDAAFVSLAQLRVGGLVVGNDTFSYNRREPDRAGRSAMNFSSWLIAVFLLLTLVGCAAGQVPPPPAPYPHDNDADIRSM